MRRIDQRLKELEQRTRNQPQTHPLEVYEVRCNGEKLLLWREENSMAEFTEVHIIQPCDVPAQPSMVKVEE